MNLSMQIGRGLIALILSLAFGAYAVSAASADRQTDSREAKVAHERLAVVDLRDGRDKPRWFMASVHVGNPVAVPEAGARQPTLRVLTKDGHG